MTWRDQAQCKGRKDIDFFKESPANLKEIRQMCVGCPVFDQCRDWSIDCLDEAPFGIVAGLTPEQRRKAQRAGVRPDWRKEDAKARNSWRTGPPVYGPPKPKMPRKPKVLSPEDQEYVDRLKKEVALTTKNEARIASRDVPECPTCSTKRDVIRTGKYADGTQRYRHLPCGLNYKETS